jgi:phage terminase small subunit
MRALPPRWQRAVTSLFITQGNRTEALRLAGYDHKNRKSLAVTACRLFQDKRVRQAVREVAAEIIDTAEPELIATTFEILRDTTTDPKNRLAAARLLWDRSRPVLTQHRVEVEHTLTTAQLDESHYRALQRIGAPESAFLARFGHNGLSRVAALVAAEDAKQKRIADQSDAIDGECTEVETQ